MQDNSRVADRRYVVVPDHQGRLAIPNPFMPLLVGIVGKKVVHITTTGLANKVNNPRLQHPAVLLIDLNTRRGERRHHVDTFTGNQAQTSGGKSLGVSKEGKILLPEETLELFSDSVRVRVILLFGNNSIDGFALQFTPRNPKR